ncbi:NAD(P)H-hydrate dehydratase [Flammeovirga kamogawensis]|uniref:Bifunctional NAD(P)H-hydrate repair enzyme n=1 Tax=Flammeovirga kamogawensis TaxID=373891 RepID=A0ABX8GVT7_9BACT|nr:NAD(P)H-hydrate dehydratase [Flammeovirga kamogawensis]MBB6461145.1 NAD(P)H-hydrate epimerase [Flammeovirga kamogawensis]QWG07711.1 NAD(P)H-hydrate dehydratase [Flammeovirga kamogawensis]TRX69518.1 NAD(P)H-hydrate dehydratase [Flammeovirga kamogawensis]
MKLFTTQQIRDWDAFTIANEPIDSIDLMERAASRLTDWYYENCERYNDITFFCGIGNNGGDGLVMARLLHLMNFKVKCYIVHFSDKISEDFKQNLSRLPKNIQCYDIKEENDLPTIEEDTVIVDCIFGSGLSRPPKGITQQTIIEINKSNNPVIAIDIASGLYADHYSTHFQTIVEADITLTLEVPKLAMLFPENDKNVGELNIIPIELSKKFKEETPSNYFFTTHKNVQQIYRPRKRFDHKGKFGNLLIVGGSKGMIGAVQLATKAGLRAGAGKTTALVPACGYEIIQATIPEAMCISDPSRNHIVASTLVSKYSAIGIGPGIGQHEQTQKAVRSIIEDAEKPIVLDADALNMLSKNEEWWSLLPKNSILTPHVGEFERLAGIQFINSFDRLEAASKMAQDCEVIVVLKGANTAICLPNGQIHFNSTGNAGLAKGGSGDALLGIISSLLAQKYKPYEAAILGVYLHGKAGDYASAEKGFESMVASDVIENLGKAFFELLK